MSEFHLTEIHLHRIEALTYISSRLWPSSHRGSDLHLMRVCLISYRDSDLHHIETLAPQLVRSVGEGALPS